MHICEVMQRSADTDFEAVHSGATITRVQCVANTMDLGYAAKQVIIFETRLRHNRERDSTSLQCDY